MGFLSVLALLYWLAYFPLGMLVAIAYYHLFGFLAFFAINVGTAYFFNQARKHSKHEAFDDRLTDDRMLKAQEWIVEQFNEEVKN